MPQKTRHVSISIDPVTGNGYTEEFDLSSVTHARALLNTALDSYTTGKITVQFQANPYERAEPIVYDFSENQPPRFWRNSYVPSNAETSGTPAIDPSLLTGFSSQNGRAQVWQGLSFSNPSESGWGEASNGGGYLKWVEKTPETTGNILLYSGNPWDSHEGYAYGPGPGASSGPVNGQTRVDLGGVRGHVMPDKYGVISFDLSRAVAPSVSYTWGGEFTWSFGQSISSSSSVTFSEPDWSALGTDSTRITLDLSNNDDWRDDEDASWGSHQGMRGWALEFSTYAASPGTSGATYNIDNFTLGESPNNWCDYGSSFEVEDQYTVWSVFQDALSRREGPAPRRMRMKITDAGAAEGVLAGTSVEGTREIY